MHFLDILEFGLYMISMIGIGYYFLKKNETSEDYFVAGRGMGSLHMLLLRMLAAVSRLVSAVSVLLWGFPVHGCFSRD